ncbi:MAG: hypothetical protein WD965_09505 [Actinomycetota bacterium]
MGLGRATELRAGRGPLAPECNAGPIEAGELIEVALAVDVVVIVFLMVTKPTL